MQSLTQSEQSAHPQFDVFFTSNDPATTLPVADLIKIQLTDEHALLPAPLQLAINPAAVYLASLGKGSQRTMSAALHLAANVFSLGRCNAITLPWHLVRIIHTKALRAWLVNERKPATGNKILSAVRGALRAAWEMELISAEDYHRTINVKPIKGATIEQAAGRALTPGEFTALMRICHSDRHPAGPRDAAILGLGILGGLRRSEIASIQLSDYRVYPGGDHKLFIGAAKGNKERIVPIHPGVQAALKDWLHWRGQEPGPLFYEVRKGGLIQPKGIQPSSIYKLLARRAKQASVAPFSPHDLRRTFAGDLLDAGADIATVQKLMGHASPTTTSGYDRRGERARVEAINRLHMHWQPQFT